MVPFIIESEQAYFGGVFKRDVLIPVLKELKEHNLPQSIFISKSYTLKSYIAAIAAICFPVKPAPIIATFLIILLIIFTLIFRLF